IDLEIVANRIIALEEMSRDYPESMYYKAFDQSRFYYYQFYFGLSGDFLFDSEGKIEDEVLDNYQETIAKYPDSQLAKDLEDYLAVLSENDNTLTNAVEIFLSDL